MNNYISFANILYDRDQFRKAGTNSGSEFNLFDTPGHKYFRLFFYFYNGDEEGHYSIQSHNGLLAPTWLLSGINDSNFYMFNSAWSYLKMNNEDERADLLVDFVNLLSNINSESPWYFSELTGLDSALNRKNIGQEYFNIDAERPKITIKCLPDSYDERIGTLLDLYRSIVWSWSTKRQILPDNLKKFDMGILIYETPNEPFHKVFDDYAHMSESMLSLWRYVTSYKYIELHNCEFGYNSSKDLYTSLNNKEGTSVEYNIDIHFDDCYEMRYNEFSMKEFGDLILYDIISGAAAADYNYVKIIFDDFDLQNKINAYDNEFLNNTDNSLASPGFDRAPNLREKTVLGNLYKFSLSEIESRNKSANPNTTVSRIEDYHNEDNSNNLSSKIEGDGKLFTEPIKTTATNQLEGSGKLFTKPAKTLPSFYLGNINWRKRIIPKIKYIKDLYEGNTLINNL